MYKTKPVLIAFDSTISARLDISKSNAKRNNNNKKKYNKLYKQIWNDTFGQPISIGFKLLRMPCKLCTNSIQKRILCVDGFLFCYFISLLNTHTYQFSFIIFDRYMIFFGGRRVQFLFYIFFFFDKSFYVCLFNISIDCKSSKNNSVMCNFSFFFFC